MTTLSTKMKEAPMNWKDWVTAIGLLLTLGTLLVRGGQLMERLEVVSRQITDLSTQVHALRADQSTTQRDITQLRGVDTLHNEQIQTLRNDVYRLQSAKR